MLRRIGGKNVPARPPFVLPETETAPSGMFLGSGFQRADYRQIPGDVILQAQARSHTWIWKLASLGHRHSRPGQSSQFGRADLLQAWGVTSMASKAATGAKKEIDSGEPPRGIRCDRVFHATKPSFFSSFFDPACDPGRTRLATLDEPRLGISLSQGNAKHYSVWPVPGLKLNACPAGEASLAFPGCSFVGPPIERLSGSSDRCKGHSSPVLACLGLLTTM